MKKQLAAFAWGLVMMLSLLPTGALAAAPALSGTAGENVTWSVDVSSNPNAITFSGTGPMDDYTFGSSNDWNRFFQSPITIESGITHVGNCAFYRSTCTSVTIAATVESIGNFAFSDCASLTTVNIGSSNITIAENAFQRCGSITSFVVAGQEYQTLEGYLQASKGEVTGPGQEEDEPLVHYVAPDGTKIIDDFAFQGCETLETVVLPEGVTTIGASAFVDCINLKSVTLPSTLTSIGGTAFYGCASLESIRLPEALEILGDNAFRGCSSLTSLTLPGNITSWGMGTFAACTGLTQLTLSQGLTSIGSSAFYNCPGVTSVTIPDSVTSIGDFAFRATGLTGVTIPKSVTYLGELPFGITNDFEWVTDFTITGYAGTEAEAYAKDCGFPFVDLTPTPDPMPTPDPDPTPTPDPGSTPTPTPSSGSSGSSSSSRHFHRWDSGVVTLEPTAKTSGLRVYTCLGCKATRSETISAGWAAPVRGSTVTITGTPNSKGGKEQEKETEKEKDPTAVLRVISSTGTNPDDQGGLAYASTQSVEVDGKAVEFQMYALKDAEGNDTNYVKLRDVALTINGTDAQCNVDWLEGFVTVTTHTPYQPNGSEMKTPFTGDRSYSADSGITVIDGERVLMQAFVLMDDNGGGYTYYKLRDLGQTLGFNVGWSSEKGVYIQTDRLYDAKN